METRFTVARDDVEAALAWLAERGFVPSRIDYGDGDADLVFATMPDDRMHALAMALPVHLGSKIGIVAGDRPPFSTRG